jgi:uncharacterized membrane protein
LFYKWEGASMTDEVEMEEEQEETLEKGSNSWRDSLWLGQEEGDSTAQRVFKILFPLALWIGSLPVAHILMSANDANQWFTLEWFYLVPPLGKEFIIPMGIEDGYSPIAMALTVAFVDLWVGMIISWNYWYLEKIPKIGDYLKKTEKKGAALMNKSPGRSKGVWWGIVAIGLIPLIGAGGFLGSLIGRFIGMRPGPVIAAVTLGSFLAGLLYAYATEALVAAFQKNPYIAATIVVIIVVGVVIAFFLHKRAKAKRGGDDDTVDEQVADAA